MLVLSHVYVFCWLFYCIFTMYVTFFKKFMTIKGIFYSYISILFIFFLALLSNFSLIVFQQSIFFWECTLIQNAGNMFEITLAIKVDMLSYFFILLVICIGFFTNIYILNYFKHEAEETKFYVLINWFILSMILFVAAENGFTLFLGWELIGLTSFFLINFWSERRGTLKASFKAFSFNKLSDIFLLLFLIILWATLGHTKFSLLDIEFVNNPHYATILLKYATVGLILSAGVKSAQLLTHTWLPDSMEAPVPASALIHSATLVSAGIYLLLRFSTIIHIYDLEWVIMCWGSATAIYGGIVAAAQTDVKKILAYSTISHCGFLFVCVSLQWIWLTITYLYLHGLFKALTFFCVGSFIRVAKSQDTRYMGVQSRLMPIDTILLMISLCNLGGLPLTLGYFYKKFFFAILFQENTSYFILGCCMLGLLTSIIYVYRLFYYTTFDIEKTATNMLVKTLQSHKNDIHDSWSFTTIIHIVTVFGLFLVTILLYNMLITVILHSELTLQQNNQLWLPSGYAINSIENLYDGYYIFFYSIYSLIIITISTINWRASYTTYHKYIFWILFFTFIFFLSIITSIAFDFQIIYFHCLDWWYN